MFLSRNWGVSDDYALGERSLRKIREALWEWDFTTTFVRLGQLLISIVSMNGRVALTVMLFMFSQSTSDPLRQSLPLMTRRSHPTVLDTSRALHLHPTRHAVSRPQRSTVISSIWLMSTFIFTSCRNPMSRSVTLERRSDACGGRRAMHSELSQP